MSVTITSVADSVFDCLCQPRDSLISSFKDVAGTFYLFSFSAATVNDDHALFRDATFQEIS